MGPHTRQPHPDPKPLNIVQNCLKCQPLSIENLIYPCTHPHATSTPGVSGPAGVRLGIHSAVWGALGVARAEKTK